MSHPGGVYNRLKGRCLTVLFEKSAMVGCLFTVRDLSGYINMDEKYCIRSCHDDCREIRDDNKDFLSSIF